MKRRKCDTEADADDLKDGECPAKQPRRRFSCISPVQLSEENLRRFNGERVNSPALERSSSQRSLATSTEDDTVRSQRSANTTASYRYKHLKAAQVYVHTDPPTSIQTAINDVVHAPVSKERRAELHDIAQQLYNSCKELVKAAVGEEDFLELFPIALRAMGHSNLCLRAKADWREEIKPTTAQQADLDLSFYFDAADGDQQQQEVEDASAPPRKRQQQLYAASDPTPDDGPQELDIMPPPPLPDGAKAHSPIKTPCPDITVGTRHEALISALSQTLDSSRADRLLDQLQGTRKPGPRGGGPGEPLLVAEPTQRASDLVFPFAVVEGKAYSTGRQVFEAENQAAVSGASGLKIQLSLDDLVSHATAAAATATGGPGPLPVPLFFSVCTEGPYHELYVHYTVVEDGVRKFNQTLLEICNGVLLKSVVEFVVMLDNVLRWGTGRFLDSVVERLGKVARRAGA